MTNSLSVSCVAVSFILVAGGATAADRLVPQQYATIQAAVNAAQDGDTILVRPYWFWVPGAEGPSTSE